MSFELNEADIAVLEYLEMANRQVFKDHLLERFPQYLPARLQLLEENYFVDRETDSRKSIQDLTGTIPESVPYVNFYMIRDHGRVAIQEFRSREKSDAEKAEKEAKERKAAKRWDFQKLVIAAFLGAVAREIITLLINLISQLLGSGTQPTP